MDSYGQGKGQQKANARAFAHDDDDYKDDDNYDYDRYQSYNYDDEYYDEEVDEQINEMAEEREKGKVTDLSSIAVDVNEKKARDQLAREKGAQDAAASESAKKKLKEEAQEAREFLIEQGLNAPDSFNDEAIIAMAKRIDNRRQCQEQDLMMVSTSVPSANVNFEENEVTFYCSSTANININAAKSSSDQEQQQVEADDSSSTTKKKTKKQAVAAVYLPDEYPEQPAEVLIKNGQYLERFCRAVLRNMSSSQYTYKPQHQNANFKNNNQDDDEENDDSMMVAANSSEPVFLSDVCRFIQKMVDMIYDPTGVFSTVVDTEASKGIEKARAENNGADDDLFTPGKIPEFLREQAVLNICSREWAALTADHFTLKPLKKGLVIKAKPKPKPANDTTTGNNGQEDDDDEEEIWQTRRRLRTQKVKPKPTPKCKPKPKVTPAPAPPSVAVTARVHADWTASNVDRFNNYLTNAFENGSEFFSFGQALDAPLSPNIGKLTNLRYLDLIGARITSLPNVLQTLPIEKLILMKNSFTSFPKAILSLRKLRILDLSWNQLTSIPAGVGKLTELRVLELSHNKIDTLCSFDHLKKLEVLDVTDNNLSGIPSEVGNLKYLWLLHIRGNPMIQIPLDIYYKGIDEIKAFLSLSSTKNLPVPPSTINEDVGYLHLQIPGNEHLRETIFAGIVPENYVPGAGDATDDYSAVVGSGEDQDSTESDTSSSSPLWSIYYREKTVEVKTDEATGTSSINTIVSDKPRLLFKTFKWLLAARVPRLVEIAFGGAAGGASNNKSFTLPEPLRDIEANLFASFVLAPSSPYLLTHYVETNRGACFDLIKRYTRAKSRKNNQEHLSVSGNEIIGISESLAHWIPVCCGDDLEGQIQTVLRNRDTDGDLQGSNDEIKEHLTDIVNQNQLLRKLNNSNSNSTSTAFNDPDLVTFIVGEERQKFFGHKSLFALRAGFFRTLFLDNMAGNSNEVVIDDVDPSVFAALVNFLYTDSHGKKMTNDNVVDLLFLSARYEVPRLRAMSECMVGFNVDVENVCRVLQMAYFLQSQKLKEACVMFVVSNRFNVEVTEDYAELQDEIREEISAKIREFKANRK